jgi:hypothetical protein
MPNRCLSLSPVPRERRPHCDPPASTQLDAKHEEDDLDALVDEILGSKPRPIDWTRLTGATAEDACAALDTWVRWLVTHYAIDTREVPACWAQHGDLFEELSALHIAHQAAFDPAGPPTGPADWHATLANTRARLQLAVARTSCRAGQHRAPDPPQWARADA